MLRRWTGLVAGLAAAMIATGAQAATLADNGKTSYCIVVAKDAIAPERTAARELRDTLKQITGAELAIRLESQVKPNAPQIIVGPSQRAKRLLRDVDWSTLGHDGIVIRTVGSNLVLAGGRNRGTLYAVYTFLEDTVGCRWWTGTESYIPHKPTLRIPALKVSYTPKLRYREAYYRDPLEHPVFATKLKLNGHMYSITPEYGDHYKILGWCHTSYALLPPDKYFKEHPDWYAEQGGKRCPDWGQLCFSNDEMRKELTRVALEWIKKDPAAGIISISQNDCFGNCQCPKCKAIEQEEGSPSGPLLRCVNAVAEEIEKQYPDVLVETLAYQYTRKPPAHVRPRRNVVIRLCSIECDFAQPLTSDSNSTFRDDMRKWSAISPNLYVWDYVTDFASYIQPQPNMRVLAPNLRFFVQNNAIGVFEQGDCATSVGDFVRLRAWLLGHLEWNPDLDPKQLTSEFLKGYYGPAAPYLQSYLDLVHDSWEKTGEKLSCYNGNISFLTLPVLNEATKLFDEAAKAVANDPVLSVRVRRERMPLDHMWLLRFNSLKSLADSRKLPFAGPKDPTAACAEFVDMARKWNARNYSEGRSLESYIPALEARFAPPPPRLEEFAKLPKQDVIEISATALDLHNSPEWVKLVDDPQAPSSQVAVMPGNHTQWAVQYHISDEFAELHAGVWKWYLVARAQGDSSGAAFNYGIYDQDGHREVVQMTADLNQSTDGKYHTYYIGKFEPKAGQYVWVSPTGNGNAVKGVYVDRIVLVRDTGK